MTYQETVDYLFRQMPPFQQATTGAYKPGLERIYQLMEMWGDPHLKVQSVHIAGTNGKGSTSSLIASVLQSSGAKVGLFTSPHLVDFRERIRINGEKIPEEYVVAFVSALSPYIPSAIEPSFFELTTAMALTYFAEEGVDIAVMEVGMGGRLDATNILTPLVSVITNVSKDHMGYLGNTLEEIAYEKAGIIKPQIPVVLGRSKETEVHRVVESVASTYTAPLIVADNAQELQMYFTKGLGYSIVTREFGTLYLPLIGDYQLENTATVLEVLRILRAKGFSISNDAVKDGFATVSKTGLKGRMEMLLERNEKENTPRVIIDTGHNEGAWQYISSMLSNWNEEGVACMLGVAADKDLDSMTKLLPKDINYFCCNASTQRALPAEELSRRLYDLGYRNLHVYPDILDAYYYAYHFCMEQKITTLFIGGSNFVVGELLERLRPKP